MRISYNIISCIKVLCSYYFKENGIKIVLDHPSNSLIGTGETSLVPITYHSCKFNFFFIIIINMGIRLAPQLIPRILKLIIIQVFRVITLTIIGLKSKIIKKN